MRNTKHQREAIDRIWVRLSNSVEDSVAIEVLKDVVPVMLSLVSFVEELQAEVNRLRSERTKLQ